MTGYNGSFPTVLPVFDGKNYEQWCVKMNVIFGFQDALETIKTGIQEPGGSATEVQKSTYKDLKKKDCKTLFLIHQCVDSTIFEKISSATTAKDAWDTLNRTYGRAEKVKKMKLQSLRKQCELLSMKEQESVGDYFNRMQVLMNSMKTCGEKFTDQQTVEKVLKSLTPKFDHIVVAIEKSKDLAKLSVEELQNSLKAYEQRLNERNSEKVQEQALQDQSSHKKGGPWGKDKKGKGKSKFKVLVLPTCGGLLDI